MIEETIISYINFISRWVLFFAVAYKAYHSREKSWVLLSAAFFINALNVESYIMEPLGIEISSDVYKVVSAIPNFLIAGLLVWGGVHLKHGASKLKHVVYISVFAVASYLWLFLLAINAFGDNFVWENLFPYLVYGGALIYFGLVLKRHAISGGGIDVLFPWGLMLLGALNLTYPFTRNIEWFVPIGFSLGALFRLMAAVGAVKFVFYSVAPPNTSGEPLANRRVFFFPSKEEAFKTLGNIWSRPGTVVITREDLRTLKSSLHPETLVFWITRAKEGKLEERPQVYAVSPTKIGILTGLIAQALAQGYKTVYIDTFEYLMLENGFEKAVKFLLNIKDRVLAEKGTIILVLNPEALDEKQRKMIEREFKEFS